MGQPKLETVATAVEDGVGLIKYNRPNNANSVSPPVFTDLLNAFKWAIGEPSVKVIVYTGKSPST